MRHFDSFSPGSNLRAAHRGARSAQSNPSLVPFPRLLCAALVALFACHEAAADVRLPAVIGDAMVLQRNSKIRVWGWADPGEPVAIAFLGNTVKTKAERSGYWSVSLGPFPAGGPYDMSIVARNSLKLSDILIGDVWLASGQSNMELPLGGFFGLHVDNAEREVAAASYPQIRLLAVQQKTAPRPDSDTTTVGWRAVTPETVGRFSAVAYFFGRELHQKYHVPIGLIEAAWGGTVAEAWMSESALQKFPEFAKSTHALAAIKEDTRTAYRNYAQRRTAWYRAHEQDDRGRVNGRNIWADPKFDSSAWPTIALPQDFSACGRDFDGFAGTIWYRRSLTVPTNVLGKPLWLSLGLMAYDDVTYFNGQRVGAMQGFLKPREYVVPAGHVRAGENTVVVRLTGINEPTFACTGLFDPDEQMTARIETTKLPLNGSWSYMPGPDLQDFPRADAVTLAANPSPNAPTTLFNGMINPLRPMRIKGVIWYQGESNADRPIQYRTLFPALINDWRMQWGYDFPFLFVQLAGFGPNKAEPADYPWAQLREAQSMSLAVPGTGMASAIDIGNENDIHPSDKQDVGHRLALAAAKVAYDEDVVGSGPTYQSMKTENQQIRLRFSNIGSGLSIRDKYGYGRGFEIAGSDGKYHWAQAMLDGQEIVVSSPLVAHPTSVRYAWSNTPDANLYNREGFPAVSFRTDKSHE
jgi:sialate O-acetylesterase